MIRSGEHAQWTAALLVTAEEAARGRRLCEELARLLAEAWRIQVERERQLLAAIDAAATRWEPICREVTAALAHGLERAAHFAREATR